MKVIIIAAVFLSASVSADHLTPTYLCTKPDGTRSAQDMPCEGSTQTAVVQTYRHDKTTQDYIDDAAKNGRDNTRKIWCDYTRQSAARMTDLNRTELNKNAAIQQRQNAINDRAYIAQNCTPYGR